MACPERADYRLAGRAPSPDRCLTETAAGSGAARLAQLPVTAVFLMTASGGGGAGRRAGSCPCQRRRVRCRWPGLIPARSCVAAFPAAPPSLRSSADSWRPARSDVLSTGPLAPPDRRFVWANLFYGDYGNDYQRRRRKAALSPCLAQHSAGNCRADKLGHAL